LQNDGKSLTNDVLRKELDLTFKTHKNQTDTTSEMELMSFIPYFIKTSTKTVGTKRNYNQVLQNLQEYEQAKKTKLTFDKIDIDFYNDFVLFLQSKRFSPNTIGTRIKILKTFMNEAYERNLHRNIDYKKKAFAKPSEHNRKIQEYGLLKREDCYNDTKRCRVQKSKKWLGANYKYVYNSFNRYTDRMIRNND